MAGELAYARRVEPQRPVALRRVDAEQAVVDQLGRLAQADAALDQAGVGDGDQAGAEQRPVDQGRLQRRLAIDHADVGIVGVEGPAAVAGAQAQPQLGVGRLEAMQPREEPARGHGDVDLHGQLARAAALAQMGGGLADPREGVAQDREQHGTGLGQLDPAAPAPEQRPAQLALQVLDLMADRRVGDAELVAGLAEAEMARRRLERAQRRERRQPGTHAHEVVHSASRRRSGSDAKSGAAAQTGKPAARMVVDQALALARRSVA